LSVGAWERNLLRFLLHFFVCDVFARSGSFFVEIKKVG
jgi:hypothetical protein